MSTKSWHGISRNIIWTGCRERWGGIPGSYFTDLVSDKAFDAFVIRLLETMTSEPRYVLGVADQVPPRSRWERIARVRPLVEKYGSYD
jgi:hypothetical protein